MSPQIKTFLPSPLRVFLAALLLPALLLSTLSGFSAAAEVPRVRDDAAFFSPDAVQKADQEILALKSQFKVDLLIDAVGAVPADKVDQFKADGKDKFFTEWAFQRATAAGIRGVYVLICKDPGHLQIEVGRDTQKQAFTLENRNALRKALLDSFKAKEYDIGLLAAIDVVRTSLQKNVPPDQTGIVPRAVKDYAGFFSPEAVEMANKQLQLMPRTPGRDVAIETFATPPPGRIDEVKRMSSAERGKFFAAWAQHRAKEASFDGVLVLICKQPGHAQIDVHGDLAQKAFTPADIKRLNEVLLPRMGKRQYDEGLADTVRALLDKFAPGAVVATAPPAQPKSAAQTEAMNPPKSPAAVATDTVKTAPPVAQSKPEEAAKSEQAAPKAEATTTVKDTSALMSLSGTSTNAGPTKAETLAPKTESSEHTTNSKSSAAASPIDDTLAKAKDKAIEVGQTQFPTWMWAAGIVGGLIALWILSSILRAMFGGGRQNPPTASPAQRTMPQTPPANPPYPAQSPAQPTTPYAHPPQVGPYAGPPQGGYPQAGYPQGGYPAPQQPMAQQGGGGGFISSALGGMAGAAAGNMIYDKFAHPGNANAPAAPGSYRPSGPSPAGSPGSFAGGAGAGSNAYNTGGDFDSPGPAVADTAAGGDFDPSMAKTDSGGGGDFDSPGPAVADTAAGGDFDSSAADTGGGGDFNSGGQAVADNSAGGDFGGPVADAGSNDQPTGGGDFDSGSSGGDVAADSSGGDNSGGDFGNS